MSCTLNTFDTTLLCCTDKVWLVKSEAEANLDILGTDLGLIYHKPMCYPTWSLDNLCDAVREHFGMNIARIGEGVDTTLSVVRLEIYCLRGYDT